MRLIDADAFLEEARNRIDMQDVYLPIHIKELVIDEMSTIEAEPVRHGKWIWEEQVYNCSVCSHKAYGNILECMDGTYKYCPNCGARMEIEENERKRANETNTTI